MLMEETFLKIIITLLKCLFFYPMLWLRGIIRAIFMLVALAGIVLGICVLWRKLAPPPHMNVWLFLLLDFGIISICGMMQRASCNGLLACKKKEMHIAGCFTQSVCKPE
jgi:hypothetical protein